MSDPAAVMVIAVFALALTVFVLAAAIDARRVFGGWPPVAWWETAVVAVMGVGALVLILIAANEL